MYMKRRRSKVVQIFSLTLFKHSVTNACTQRKKKEVKREKLCKEDWNEEERKLGRRNFFFWKFNLKLLHQNHITQRSESTLRCGFGITLKLLRVLCAYFIYIYFFLRPFVHLTIKKNQITLGCVKGFSLSLNCLRGQIQLSLAASPLSLHNMHDISLTHSSHCVRVIFFCAFYF